MNYGTAVKSPIVEPKYSQAFDGSPDIFEFRYGREALDTPAAEAAAQALDEAFQLPLQLREKDANGRFINADA